MLPPESERPTSLSWLDPRVLLQSRNELVARIYDPVPQFRRRWMSRLDDPGQLVVDLGLGAFSFALMGDTGEGDNSQYALLPTLRECADASFLLICSDLIYPAASVEDYLYKFYWPYQTLPLPIYACPATTTGTTASTASWSTWPDVRPLPPEVPTEVVPTSLLSRIALPVRRAVGTALWRKPAVTDDLRVAAMKKLRGSWPQPVRQPGPYFVLDTEHVRLVCIDPGILGNLDRQQAEWLVRVSGETVKPKVLLTGKPLLVDGQVDPCPLLGTSSPFAAVLDVVHHEPFGYVATIGGDVHNYQHYPVRLPGGHTVHHVVSGGGGAFMHATHAIPKIDAADVLGVTEEQFKCYPLRRDSMAVYATVIDARWQKSRIGRVLAAVGIRPRLIVTPEEAGIFLRDTCDIQSLGNRPIVDTDGASTAGELPAHVRRMCHLLLRLGGGKVFHRAFSPFLDWDQTAVLQELPADRRRREGPDGQCFSVTGALEQEDLDMVEDAFTVALGQEPAPG